MIPITSRDSNALPRSTGRYLRSRKGENLPLCRAVR